MVIALALALAAVAASDECSCDRVVADAVARAVAPLIDRLEALESAHWGALEVAQPIRKRALQQVASTAAGGTLKFSTSTAGNNITSFEDGIRLGLSSTENYAMAITSAGLDVDGDVASGGLVTGAITASGAVTAASVTTTGSVVSTTTAWPAFAVWSTDPQTALKQSAYYSAYEVSNVGMGIEYGSTGQYAMLLAPTGADGYVTYRLSCVGLTSVSVDMAVANHADSNQRTSMMQYSYDKSEWVNISDHVTFGGTGYEAHSGTVTFTSDVVTSLFLKFTIEGAAHTSYVGWKQLGVTVTAASWSFIPRVI